MKLDTQHNIKLLLSYALFMLSVDMLNVVVMLSVHIADCRYDECCHADGQYADCHYAECRYSECCHADG
jgi:hypothetical protein